MPIPSRDIIVFTESENRWVIMNVFTRTSLGVNSEALKVLNLTSYHNINELQNLFGTDAFKVWEIEWFSNYKGLFADPTRYLRKYEDWPEPEVVDVMDLVLRLKKHYLIVDDEAQYRSCFASKTSLLDRKHFGNFHQQMGQELMVKHRESPEEWWVKQKFSGDKESIREGHYKAVQEYFLKSYFKSKFSEGNVIVDIGCGTGFYSNLMAETGAFVLGVDPHEEYIQSAKKKSIENARFETLQVGEIGAMDHIPTDSADYVFMSDALLFYFVPVLPKKENNIQTLLSDICRILKPEGCFINVEPHYIFWLLPWLGNSDRPFTILTEYIDKSFGVTPSISSLIQEYIKGGFAVTWMEELTPDPTFEATNQRAYHFAKQFPLWQLFELKPMSS